jgi:type VI secretion system protein ImpH
LPFVVLVRWLERLFRADATGAAPGPVQRQAGSRAGSEPVRFRHDPGFGFHSADIVEATLVEPADAPCYVELTTSFCGLTGAVSPLPPGLVEHLGRDDNDDNAVQRAFLDLFHHRLLGLFFRGLLKCDLARGSEPDGRGRTLDWVLLMAGLAPLHAERLTGLSRPQLLSLAPLLVTYPHNVERIAVALRFILHDVLGGAELHILQLRGTLAEIEPGSRVRLGIDLRLGQTSTLGQRAPAPSSELVVHIMPLPPEACARLRPGGDRFAELSAVAGLFCPETIRVSVELTPTNTPPARLGARGARLGRDAWLPDRGRPHPICFAAVGS